MRRALTVLGLALVACGSGAAWGQQSSACVVIDDPAGDESGPAPGPLAADPSLDLQRVTLSSDGHVLTAVLTIAPGGRAGSRVWSVSFGNGEQGYALSAFEHVDGDRFGAYGPGSSTNKPAAGEATGSIDLAAGRIRIAVPLAQIHVGPRASFHEFSASAGRSLGSNTATGPQSTSTPFLGGDSGTGSTHYRLDRGCRH